MALDPLQEKNFEKALAFVLAQEGGYTNDPADHGGATNLGIIQTEYDAWRGGHSQARQSVKFISSVEARQIYLEKYWLPVHCGLLAWPACAALFDSVVNTGLSQGVKFLQRSLGVTDDGVCGPATQAAMAKANGAAKIRDKIVVERSAFYHHLVDRNPSQSVFLKGWLNRCQSLSELA